MAITNYLESEIVFIILKEGDTRSEVMEFVSDQFSTLSQHHVFWDMSEYDFRSSNAETVNSVVDTLSGFTNRDLSNLKRAFYVDNDLGFGIMRMLSSTAEQAERAMFRVFRDKQEALEWLKN